MALPFVNHRSLSYLQFPFPRAVTPQSSWLMPLHQPLLMSDQISHLVLLRFVEETAPVKLPHQTPSATRDYGSTLEHQTSLRRYFVGSMQTGVHTSKASHLSLYYQVPANVQCRYSAFASFPSCRGYTRIFSGSLTESSRRQPANCCYSCRSELPDKQISLLPIGLLCYAAAAFDCGVFALR